MAYHVQWLIMSQNHQKSSKIQWLIHAYAMNPIQSVCFATRQLRDLRREDSAIAHVVLRPGMGDIWAAGPIRPW